MSKSTVAPRRLPKRAAVRETIKRLPIPKGTAPPDMLALFDAVSDEVKMGRSIVEAVERLAERPNPPKAVA